MRHLILIRHAEARPRMAAEKDAARPLTEAGLLDATMLGRALAAAGYAPDRALVSTSVRTRQTWQGAVQALPGVVTAFEPALYNAPAAEIARLAGAVSTGTLVIVGHNPGISSYAASLATTPAGVGPSGAPSSFAPATAAVFRMEADRPALERVFRAREYGAGA